MARERRQCEKKKRRRKQRVAAPSTAPLPAEMRERNEAGNQGIGEQHVLPDDALINRQLRREDAKRGDERGSLGILGASLSSDSMAPKIRSALPATNSPLPGTTVSASPSSHDITGGCQPW